VSSTTKSEGPSGYRTSLASQLAFLTLPRYHWGFLVGPKVEKKAIVPGTRYHVKNRPMEGWCYEEVSLVNVQSTNSLLARITIAKVEDEAQLVKILRSTPVVQNDPNWRCRSWVVDVLDRLAADGKAVGTAQLDWSRVEALAREYVAQKTAAGRYNTAEDMLLPKPTWDMLESKEMVP